MLSANNTAKIQTSKYCSHNLTDWIFFMRFSQFLQNHNSHVENQKFLPTCFRKTKSSGIGFLLDRHAILYFRLHAYLGKKLELLLFRANDWFFKTCKAKNKLHLGKILFSKASEKWLCEVRSAKFRHWKWCSKKSWTTHF